MNRHPKAVTRPPITAVRRVDLRRQKDIVKGDISNETAVDMAPSHPETNEKSRSEKFTKGKMRKKFSIHDPICI